MAEETLGALVQGFVQEYLESLRHNPSAHEKAMRRMFQACILLLLLIGGLVGYMGHLFISEQRTQGHEQRREQREMNNRLAEQNSVQLVLQEKVAQWVGHVQVLNTQLHPLFTMRADIEVLARRTTSNEEHIRRNTQAIERLEHLEKKP